MLLRICSRYRLCIQMPYGAISKLMKYLAWHTSDGNPGWSESSNLHLESNTSFCFLVVYHFCLVLLSLIFRRVGWLGYLPLE